MLVVCYNGMDVHTEDETCTRMFQPSEAYRIFSHLPTCVTEAVTYPRSNPDVSTLRLHVSPEACSVIEGKARQCQSQRLR